MPMNRKSIVGIVSISALLILLAVIAVVRYEKTTAKTLGEGPLIQYQKTAVPDLAVREFLDGDIVIIEDVKALPRPVLQAFTEIGGSRPIMANPGERFEATDLISDSSIPRKRLIFAGVSGNRCFVHYEQGGRGHSYVLALFALTSADTMNPIWQGQCGPAANIRDLRSQVDGGCSRR
jgi:hypothetical protein